MLSGSCVLIMVLSFLYFYNLKRLLLPSLLTAPLDNWTFFKRTSDLLKLIVLVGDWAKIWAHWLFELSDSRVMLLSPLMTLFSTREICHLFTPKIFKISKVFHFKTTKLYASSLKGCWAQHPECQDLVFPQSFSLVTGVRDTYWLQQLHFSISRTLWTISFSKAIFSFS